MKIFIPFLLLHYYIYLLFKKKNCLSFYFESNFLFISLRLVDVRILQGRLQDRTPTEPAGAWRLLPAGAWRLFSGKMTVSSRSAVLEDEPVPLSRTRLRRKSRWNVISLVSSHRHGNTDNQSLVFMNHWCFLCNSALILNHSVET